MTNPLVPFAGELYTGGVKTQVFLIPAAQSASYWTAADTAAVSGIIADIINNGTVPLSTSLGSISGAFSATIGSISGAFSSTIAAIVAGSATVDAEARATATLALYDASQAQLTANSKGNAWLTSSHFAPSGSLLHINGAIELQIADNTGIGTLTISPQIGMGTMVVSYTASNNWNGIYFDAPGVGISSQTGSFDDVNVGHVLHLDEIAAFTKSDGDIIRTTGNRISTKITGSDFTIALIRGDTDFETLQAGMAWLTSSHLSPAGNALAVTGTVTSTGSAGSVLVGNSSEFGVTVSASGMASYVGFTATNPSGSAIDATINPNNGAIVFNLGHNPTDGGTDASTIQAATNNGFVNSGGPTFMGQHASLPFRIYGTSGLAFGTTSADVCQVTGILHLNDIIRLKSVASSTRADGDIWRDGEKFYFFMTGTRYEINLTAAP